MKKGIRVFSYEVSVEWLWKEMKKLGPAVRMHTGGYFFHNKMRQKGLSFCII